MQNRNYEVKQSPFGERRGRLSRFGGTEREELRRTKVFDDLEEQEDRFSLAPPKSVLSS